MAHTCPDCGQSCHCGGDVEDHETGDNENCTHCPEGLQDEDVAETLHNEDKSMTELLDIPAFLRRTKTKEEPMTNQENPSDNKPDFQAAITSASLVQAAGAGKRTAEYTPTPEEAERMGAEIAAAGLLPEPVTESITPEKIPEMIRNLRAKEEAITKKANEDKKKIRAAIAALKDQSKKMLGDL